MSPRWVMAMVGIFFLLSLLSSIGEGLYMTGSSSTTIIDVIQYFTNINYGSVTVYIPFTGDIAVGAGMLLKAIWTMIIWDYSFLTGSFLIVRYLLIALSAGFFVAFMYETIRLVKIGG